MNRRKINRNRIEKHHITPKCLLKHKDKAFINHPLNLAYIPHHEHCKAHKWLFMLLGDSCDNGICSAYYGMCKGHFYMEQKGKKLSKETRKKISENHHNVSGDNNPFYGKSHSTESRKKISDANTGKKMSKEARKKMSKAQAGKVLSEEHKKKIGESHIGLPVSEETRKKLSILGKERFTDEMKEKLRIMNTGRKHSEESRKKMSDAGKGRIFTEEHRNNMSKAQKGIVHYSIKCSCQGMLFNSIKGASQFLSKSERTISNYCKDPRKPDYFYL